MNETEFKEMVIGVRQAESAIGIESYELTDKQKSGKVFSRSLYIAKDMKKGDILDETSLRSVRPGFSLHPKYYYKLLGKKAIKDFTIGDRIKKEDFE